MSKPTPFGGRSAASSGPRWAKMLFENFHFNRGSRGAPLGLPPPLGERGGNYRKAAIAIAAGYGLHRGFFLNPDTDQSRFLTVSITVLSALTRAYHLLSDSMTVHGAIGVLVRASISSIARS